MTTTTTTESNLEPLRELTDVALGQEAARTDVSPDHDSQDETAVVDTDQQAQRAPHPPPSDVENAERALADVERRRGRLIADHLAESERQRADGAVRTLGDERRAMDESLNLERAETDARLLVERAKTDEIVDDASLLLFDEQAAHAHSKTAVVHRDQLLAMVSHELRSPLTAIMLNAQYLADVPGADLAETPIHTIAVDIQAACAQMTRLVSDLLDLASMDAGKLKVTLALGDATEVMRTAIAASSPMLEAQTLSVTVESPREPLWARFDHARLLQVFANLFANAGKFTGRRGKISVSVRRMGGALKFCVADNGCGIPADALPHVFDRFWQLGGNDRRGLGLGLTICKAIIEAHGGRIWASSEVGAGSSFFFTVPATS